MTGIPCLRNVTAGRSTRPVSGGYRRETVLGYLNAALKHPDRPEYMENAKSTWEYIRTYMVDPREGSEWFWDCDADNRPSDRKPIVEPWKCPYHNGRMCLEIIRRLG
jgi:mannobiose 2-epimerase